jgi:uridine phosphorylase
VTGPEPIHLNPATDMAERVLLPGDPQRALAVSQALLEAPKMMNARRGLWGYTGTAPDGGLVTVQSTGMGGPSAAIVAEELIDHGARTLIRIGTCGALADGLELGRLVPVEASVATDGASRALGAGERIAGDAALGAALAARADRAALVATTDLFYDPDPERAHRWREQGAVAVEMEAAAVMAAGARRGMRVGCLLGVSDITAVAGPPQRLDHEALVELGLRLGREALDALAQP